MLCNGTLTFYSLPELSPVDWAHIKQCNWIGGLDLNDLPVDHEEDRSGPAATTILVSAGKQIRLLLLEVGQPARYMRVRRGITLDK